LEGPYYRVHDEMGESGLQWSITHLLVELLRYYFEYQGRTMLVSGNQYIYFRQGDEQAGLAPDIYVIADEPTPPDEVDSWRIWEHGGRGPCLAVEVVADNPKEARKDYAPEQLEKYEAMGVTELFRYDPHCGPGRHILGQRRQLLTHWVRDAGGRLKEQPLSHPDRARSQQFGFWLVHGPPRRLYLGMAPDGLLRWPTRAEAAARRAEEEARRAEEETRRAEGEAHRAEEEARRAEEETRRAEAVERELEEARAEIERLRALLPRT
jgi:Uma2 family endonuclease